MDLIGGELFEHLRADSWDVLLLYPSPKFDPLPVGDNQ